jgi:hypothetical protein
VTDDRPFLQIPYESEEERRMYEEWREKQEKQEKESDEKTVIVIDL